jgi:hypothetical protein
MINIFGTTYYTWIGPYPLLFITAFVIFIMVVFILDHWLKTRRFKIPMKLFVSALALLIIEVLLFWDVYWIGQEAKILCKEKAGIHIFHSAEVDALPVQYGLKDSEINRLLKLGYRFVIASEATGPHQKLFRYSLKNNTITKEAIDKYTNRYRFRSNHPGKVINRYFTNKIRFIEDTRTGEIMGESVLIVIHPGKVDSWLLRKTGLSFTPWFCGDHGYSLAEKTLIPRTY